jgi:hypothetical protein
MIPFGGDLASKSVLIENPLFQQALVVGPLVQTGSATRVVVACLGTRSKLFSSTGAAVVHEIPARRGTTTVRSNLYILAGLALSELSLRCMRRAVD